MGERENDGIAADASVQDIRLTGFVRTDLLVPLADVELHDVGRRLRERVRVRMPFFIEIDDGRVLAVEPSAATLATETHERSGLWSDVNSQFAAFLLFPQVQLGPHDYLVQLAVRERTACNGDLVTVQGLLVGRFVPGNSYREAGARREAVRATTITVQQPSERNRERLSARERLRYRVDHPPTVPSVLFDEHPPDDSGGLLASIATMLESIGDIDLDD